MFLCPSAPEGVGWGGKCEMDAVSLFISTKERQVFKVLCVHQLLELL